MDNLLLTSTVKDASNYQATLVQNTYDGSRLTAAPSVPNHDPNYRANVTLRGLVTTQMTPGNAVTATYGMQ